MTTEKMLSLSSIQQLYTNLGTKLTLVKQNQGKFNWLFIPGGPGFGSEYFYLLTSHLTIPGNIWHVDFPGNGTNKIPTDHYDFNHWYQCLIEATKMFDNVILVGHSFAGALILSVPEVEQHIRGLVLINTVIGPLQEWQEAIARKINGMNLPSFDIGKNGYLQNRTNENLKKMLKAATPHFFTPENVVEGSGFLEDIPLSHQPFDWAFAEFVPNYIEKWVPTNIPTLVIGSEKDYRTPFELFKNDNRFHRDNIKLLEIKGAGHIPWVENPKDIISAFKHYVEDI